MIGRNRISAAMSAGAGYGGGALLVLLVDVLWTASNFLASNVLYVESAYAGRMDTINRLQ